MTRASERAMSIVGELGAAQVHLGRARDALKSRRSDLVPLVDHVQAQVWDMAMDLAQAVRQVDAWGRDGKCLNCEKLLSQHKGPGRPKKYCDVICERAQRAMQRRLARKAGR